MSDTTDATHVQPGTEYGRDLPSFFERVLRDDRH